MVEKDSDDYRFGRALYEDSDSFFKKSKMMYYIGIIFLTSIGCFFVILPFLPLSDLPILIGVLFGGGFILMGMIVMLNPEGRFKIYEQGIKFASKRCPIIYFKDIDHIEMLKIHRSSIPYFKIVTKSRDVYLIAGGSAKHNQATVEDYKTVSQIIIEKTKEAHKGEDNIRLIIDGNKSMDASGHIYEHSIQDYSFSDLDFAIKFVDGRQMNYKWEDIVSVSRPDSFPIDNFLKVKFSDNNELSLARSQSENKFIYTFLKEYDRYLDKLEKDLSDK